jgi:proteasome lid subunit RPN8/RPN11
MARTLHVTRSLFEATWLGLQRRSQGAQETACVWLGNQDGEREIATEIVFLDDLPGTVGRRLQHRTSREAVRILIDRARELGLTIVGDVHTHPGQWVDLSEVDRAHPIEYRIGLLALVFPSFAQGSPWLDGVGVHEYLGSGQWTRFEGDDVASRLQLEQEGP